MSLIHVSRPSSRRILHSGGPSLKRRSLTGFVPILLPDKALTWKTRDTNKRGRATLALRLLAVRRARLSRQM
jgi:hypothetical protein